MAILHPLSSIFESMPIELSTPPNRILLIKPSAIGDVVHALPILNLLRKRWSAAHISWLVTPGCAGLLEGHPHLDTFTLTGPYSPTGSGDTRQTPW